MSIIIKKQIYDGRSTTQKISKNLKKLDWQFYINTVADEMLSHIERENWESKH